MLPVASFSCIVASMFTSAAGAQGLLLLSFPSGSMARVMLWSFLVMGSVGMVCGGMIYAGRVRCTLVSMGIHLAALFCTVLWTVYALAAGLFIPLPAMAAVLAATALLLTALSFPSVLEVAARRDALYKP